MISVESVDASKGVVILVSDRKLLGDQISELNQPGCDDVALAYCAENGIQQEGVHDVGGRAVRFLDADTHNDLGSKVNNEYYRDNPDKVHVRRFVYISTPASPMSSLAKLHMKSD